MATLSLIGAFFWSATFGLLTALKPREGKRLQLKVSQAMATVGMMLLAWSLHAEVAIARGIGPALVVDLSLAGIAFGTHWEAKRRLA